jgi:FixJ family two-component response regulator
MKRDTKQRSDEPTVFIVDDDPAVRASLTFLLESIGLRTASFGSAAEFLASYDPARRGCLVLDVRMPGMSGLELQEELASAGLAIPVIVISAYGEVAVAVRSMKAGAIDFLEKPLRDHELLERINRALDIDRRRHERRVALATVEQRLGRLSQRERQVMELVVQGKANKVIAADLKVSQKTVEVHRARVLSKMEVGSTPELVRVVVEHTTTRQQDGRAGSR